MLLKPIARCDRCGREFLTMPKDGMDHYGVREYGTNISRICGGTVKPLVFDEQSAGDK